MMKYLLSILFSLSITLLNAQTVQWASKVIKVSSQRPTTKGGAEIRHWENRIVFLKKPLVKVSQYGNQL